MLIGVSILPAQDALAKHLSASFPALQVVWARYVFHFAILAPIILTRFPIARVRASWSPLQGLRGGLFLLSTVFYFLALTRLSVAETLALFFVSPLVVTLLAPALLKEQVGWRRGVATLIGFTGVVLVLRPGAGVFDPFALFGLAAGVVNGVYFLVTRKIAGTAPPLVTLGYTAAVGAVVATAVTPFAWVTPTLPDLALMLALGAASTVGHYFVIKAFDHAPASILAPIGYAEMITASLVSLLIFHDMPSLLTWGGIAIIVGSGIYITLAKSRADVAGTSAP